VNDSAKSKTPGARPDVTKRRTGSEESEKPVTYRRSTPPITWLAVSAGKVDDDLVVGASILRAAEHRAFVRQRILADLGP
jgi:hypothetical protein